MTFFFKGLLSTIFKKVGQTNIGIPFHLGPSPPPPLPFPLGIVLLELHNVPDIVALAVGVCIYVDKVPDIVARAVGVCLYVDKVPEIVALAVGVYIYVDKVPDIVYGQWEFVYMLIKCLT